MKSVRQLLSETKLSKIVESIGDDAEAGAEAFDFIVPGDRPSKTTDITASISMLGRGQIRTVCRHWNIHTSQLIRLALVRVMKEFGYKCDGVLSEIDRKAMRRVVKARRPFTTADFATMERGRKLVKALDARRNDTPQPPGVHDDGDPEPGEEQ